MAGLKIRSKTGRLWEACIGLEVHAQILCRTKLFSGACAELGPHGGKPNQQVSLVDAALPGTLPVINRQAVNQAIRTGLALNGKINQVSRFERKHYFYCDLPQGYQITQQAAPIVQGGYLTLEPPVHGNQKGGKKKSSKNHKGTSSSGSDEVWNQELPVRINRIQLEQDSGKSLHDGRLGVTLVDLNRAGSALMEIVFEPDLRSSLQAAELLRTLQATLRQLGTCDGNMEDGSIRCDLNVSVKPAEAKAWGERVEVKNMNSVKSLVTAADFEISRQIESLEGGQAVEAETRAFDVVSGQTRRLRSKEGAVDYRFFPEPDLPPLVLDTHTVKHLRDTLPELPQAAKKRLMQDYGLSRYDASVLVGEAGALTFFEQVAKGRDPKVVANWICNDLFGLLKHEGSKYTSIAQSPVTAIRLAKMLDLLKSGTVSVRIAKDLLACMMNEEDAESDPEDIVKRKNWQQITDPKELSELCHRLVADPAHARQLKQYQQGKGRMKQYFLGQAMKETAGRANPEVLEAAMVQALDKTVEFKV